MECSSPNKTPMPTPLQGLGNSKAKEAENLLQVEVRRTAEKQYLLEITAHFTHEIPKQDYSTQNYSMDKDGDHLAPLLVHSYWELIAAQEGQSIFFKDVITQCLPHTIGLIYTHAYLGISEQTQ